MKAQNNSEGMQNAEKTTDYTSETLSLALEEYKIIQAKIDISWVDVARTADQIIVFGSASMGLDRPNSDLDLLCIGEGKRLKSKELDVIWKSGDQIQHRKWLGSELAGHIAKYGIWIHGKNTWGRNVRLSNAAIDYKRRLIVGRATALEKAWDNINRGYRLKHVVKLRRDLQRLRFLTDDKAVPPTPVLDRLWRKQRNPLMSVSTLVKRIAKTSLVTERQVNLFREFWGDSF